MFQKIYDKTMKEGDGFEYLNKYLESSEFKKSVAILDELKRLLMVKYKNITREEMSFILDKLSEYDVADIIEAKILVLKIAKRYMKNGNI